MALVLENAVETARASAVGEWVTMLGEQQLRERAQLVGDIEAHKSRVVTSVLSQSFERPEGFPTVVEAGAAGHRSKRRNKKVVFASAAALTVAALAVAATQRSAWRAAVAGALGGQPTLAPDPPEPRPDPPSVVATVIPSAPSEWTAAVTPPSVPSDAPDPAPTSSATKTGGHRPPAGHKPPRGKLPPPLCDPPFTIAG